MTSSEQIRKWYHQGVVLNHADRGTPGYEPVCNHRHPTVAFPRSGGVFNEPVHPLCHEAFEAYAAVMRHMGVNMPSAGGVNHCRNIGTSDDPSLHAYLCAIDLPPNSFKSAAFLAAILAIRTNSGARVFRNLSGDRMHDQIDCSPADLATGIDWSTVVGSSTPGEETMLPFNKGDDSEDIRLAKDRMNETYGTGLDMHSTVYDAAMKSAVADKLGKYTGEPAGKSGDKINANMWNGLLRDFIIKLSPTGSVGPKGDRGDKGDKGDDGADSPPTDTSTFVRKGETVVIKGST